MLALASQTCGSLYHALVQQFFPLYPDQDHHGLHALILACPADPPAYAAFSLGFMTGQCEKVATGAARLFVIRPAPAWIAWTIEAMQLLCAHYGLAVRVVTVQAVTPWVEVWGYQPAWESLVTEAAIQAYPSILGHQLRGALCGVPSWEIDTAYHERAGHGVVCEPDTAGEVAEPRAPLHVCPGE